jgi:hypothetical protein
MTKIVRPIHAHETETVRIVWTLMDGTRFEQEVTVPPKPTREARAKEEHGDKN